MKTKGDTKRLLIDATKDILCEKGSFTVKDITERAFTNVAAINYHFGDKNNLIRIAIGELIDGVKSDIINTFDREFTDNTVALDSVFDFLLEFYSHYKGAVKYILMFNDEEAESRYIERFFFDEKFNEIIINRIAEISLETDRDKIFYQYAIALSAFMIPLMLEGKNSSVDNKLSLSALSQGKNRSAFTETLLKIFM